MPSYDDVYTYLRSLGMSHAHAAGAAINAGEESGFDPAVMGDKGTAHGLFQFRGDRASGMKRVAGKNWRDNWKGQLDYAVSEPDFQSYLNTPFEGVNPAASWFTQYYERPAEKHARERNAKRGGMVSRAGQPQGSPSPPVTISAAQIGAGPAYQGGSVQPVSAPAGTPVPGGQQMPFNGMDGSDYLHPAIKAIMERQQQSQGADWGDALLGMGMGILNAGGGPGAGNWFGRGVQGAAQMMSAGQPEKMTELQLLKANGELQALEDKARERKRKREATERLKESMPEKYRAAVEAGIIGKDAYAEIMGLGNSDPATYGKSGVPFQIGEFEDGTPKYGMMQLADDGSSKMHDLPKGYEPKWGPGQQGEIAAAKEGGAQSEKLRYELATQTGTQLATIDSSLRGAEDFLERFEAGEFNRTGPITGALNDRLGDVGTAVLAAKEIDAVLQNLQITNLAPVTEKEIELLRKMYASTSRTPEQNKAILREIIKARRAKKAALSQIRDMILAGVDPIKIQLSVGTPGENIDTSVGGAAPTESAGTQRTLNDGTVVTIRRKGE